jgi:uroporphyrinogen-III synthase
LKPVVVILRPEPGASATAERARRLGLQPVVAPLFDLGPVPWEAPDPRRHDAILFTSANAPRLAGPALAALHAIPAYAVGKATAAAARAAGFAAVTTGPADGDALLALAAAAGVRTVLHLCGREHRPLRHPDVEVERRIVYAADEREAPLDLPARAVVLVHSPRAAAALARKVADRGQVRLALISPAAADAAGEGWGAAAVAAEPRDEAVLEVARRLCQKGSPDAAGAGA